MPPDQQTMMVHNSSNIFRKYCRRGWQPVPDLPVFSEIPIGIDHSVVGAFFVWASERFSEVKVNEILPHMVMIRSVGVIYCNSVVQVMNSKSEFAIFTLEDPDLFAGVEKHLRL